MKSGIDDRKENKMKKELTYKNPYGLWKVTTEGDCEGRSTRDLGIFKGYIDEIAFALADKCFYSLEFKYIDEKDYTAPLVPESNTVSVSLDVDSGTWDLNSNERAFWARKFLSNRDVEVLPGQYYASFILKTGKKTAEDIKKEAMDKLTKEEIEALGLK